MWCIHRSTFPQVTQFCILKQNRNFSTSRQKDRPRKKNKSVVPTKSIIFFLNFILFHDKKKEIRAHHEEVFFFNDKEIRLFIILEKKKKEEENKKDADYPEVANSENVQWLVLGHELYGYTLKEAKSLVAKLAEHKSKRTIFFARRTSQILWNIKFWDILSCTLVRSIADHYIPADLSGRRAPFVQDFFPYLEDLL